MALLHAVTIGIIPRYIMPCVESKYAYNLMDVADSPHSPLNKLHQAFAAATDLESKLSCEIDQNLPTTLEIFPSPLLVRVSFLFVWSARLHASTEVMWQASSQLHHTPSVAPPPRSLEVPIICSVQSVQWFLLLHQREVHFIVSQADLDRHLSTSLAYTI